MKGAARADLCVIGAGSGGLSVAAGAAQMGASVVLIEAGEMGGDCLNHGCVPSKALIAAAAHAQALREGAAFGIGAVEPKVDFGAVAAHVAGVIAGIAPHDSQARFEGLGVRVIRARAAFVAPRVVRAGEAEITARRFVIATGSRPAVPPVPGLAAAGFLTNETVFGLRERPEHLLVLGGGAVGIELAQAYRRLGARVSVIEADRALGREDPELAGVVLDRLRAEGVSIHEGVAVARAARRAGGIALDERAGLYEGSYQIIRDYPLTGVGIGGFASRFPQYRVWAMNPYGVFDKAHSTPLQVAVETGLPFAILLGLGWLMAGIVLAVGVVRRRRRFVFPATGLALWTLLTLHMQVDFSPQIAGVMIPALVLLGVCLAQSIQSRMGEARGGSRRRRRSGRSVAPR